MTQQDKIERLLKDVPEHSARLVEELPKLTADLARILRETERLREVAALLRRRRRGSIPRWPAGPS